MNWLNCFFFFKQKTAYEITVRDWSSDVCSSDLKEVRNLATALYVHCERLFTFLEVKGVEPTNNGAKRALRTAVQWRKICFGNRSRSGEIATARLLTVTQTCKWQQRR